MENKYREGVTEFTLTTQIKAKLCTHKNFAKRMDLECLKLAADNAEADHHPIKIEWVHIVIKGSITSENNIIK